MDISDKQRITNLWSKIRTTGALSLGGAPFPDSIYDVARKLDENDRDTLFMLLTHCVADDDVDWVIRDRAKQYADALVAKVEELIALDSAVAAVGDAVRPPQSWEDTPERQVCLCVAVALREKGIASDELVREFRRLVVDHAEYFDPPLTDEDIIRASQTGARQQH